MISTPEHWQDAEQAGTVGLLEALDKYRPELAGPGGFWRYARIRVRDEVRNWLDVGVYWRKHPHKGRAALEAIKSSAIHCSITVGESAEEIAELRHDATPEALYAEAEERALLEGFAGTLTINEREILLAEDHRRTTSRRHKKLVSQARATLRAKDGAQ